jgi:hypothetical protein
MSRPSKSLLMQPDAKARLERAAEAIGCTIEQLADLVVDSGALTLPLAADDGKGITQTRTLDDLGQQMWLELSTQSKPERSQWFEDLLPVQKTALIVHLRSEGWSSEVIGKELGRATAWISRIYNEHADDIGAQVVSLRLNTIAGLMQLGAERAQQGLQEAGDWSGYWKVQKDFTKMLQDLGIVDRAVHRIDVTHRVDEQTRAEVDAMLDLERKRDKRIEEIRQAEFQLVESSPQITLEGEGDQ